MSENIEDSLRSWLSEQGYPLEMRVARSFMRAGFGVIQSAYYSTPDTAIQREVDVIAYRDFSSNDRLVRVEFVIECKSSKKKPWLLFSGNQRGLADPARVVQRIGTTRGLRLLDLVCQRADVQQLALFSLFPPIAYSATQALTSGNDVVYAAATAVGNAASGLAMETDAAHHQGRSIIKLLFPVVTVDGQLFSCHLDEKSDLQLIKQSHGTLLWRNRLGRMPHTIIHILTEESVQQFADQMRKSIDEFFKLITPEIEHVFSIKLD